MKLAVLAFDRETLIIAALAAMIIAGLVVSVGAAVLLRRERPKELSPEEPGEPTGV